MSAVTTKPDVWGSRNDSPEATSHSLVHTSRSPPGEDTRDPYSPSTHAITCINCFAPKLAPKIGPKLRQKCSRDKKRGRSNQNGKRKEAGGGKGIGEDTPDVTHIIIIRMMNKIVSTQHIIVLALLKKKRLAMRTNRHVDTAGRGAGEGGGVSPPLYTQCSAAYTTRIQPSASPKAIRLLYGTPHHPVHKARTKTTKSAANANTHFAIMIYQVPTTHQVYNTASKTKFPQAPHRALEATLRYNTLCYAMLRNATLCYATLCYSTLRYTSARGPCVVISYLIRDGGRVEEIEVAVYRVPSQLGVRLFILAASFRD